MMSSNSPGLFAHVRRSGRGGRRFESSHSDHIFPVNFSHCSATETAQGQISGQLAAGLGPIPRLFQRRGRALSVKKALRTAQSRFGFLKTAKDEFYLRSRRILRRPHEPFFKALPLIAEQFDGSYVDVGANIGQSINSIRMFVPNAMIHAFEPNPDLSEKLVRRYRADERTLVRRVGLGARDGSFRLYVPSYYGFVYDGLGSLDRDAAASWINSDTVYFFQPSKLVIRDYLCRVERLDDQPIRDPIFIKIDVQGTEADVVKGGLETLGKHEPILLIEDYHTNVPLQELLAPLGYEPFAFDDGRFKAGASDTSSFLMTRARSRVLV